MALGLASPAWMGAALAQEPAPIVETSEDMPALTPTTPLAEPAPTPTPEPAAAVEEEPAPAPLALDPAITPEGHGVAVAGPALDPNTQVVRFQGPEGLGVEVLAPRPEPVSVGDGGGILTTGLQRGVGYRLRLDNIPHRPGVELFPIVQVVGHMHRPAEIDPGKYPIRVVFTDEELWDVADNGRMITKVIYLEDPEQAAAYKVEKDEVPTVGVGPSEDPVRVAAALGRVMAIVRIGGRRPTIDEINAGATGDLELDHIMVMGSAPGHCGFISRDGNPCMLPPGPACPPLEPSARPTLPRDEYLCDGGDQGAKAGVSGSVGVDPRDSVIRFDVGLDRYPDPKVLPTNRVCIYAPRFAEVHASTGASVNVEIHGLNLNTLTQKAGQAEKTDQIRDFVKNQAPELVRDPTRAAGMKGKVFAGENSRSQEAMGYGNIQQAKTSSQEQIAETARQRAKPMITRDKVQLEGIKTAESPIISALTEGPGQTRMSWPANEMTGVETPPNRPGLAVVKRVNVTEAEPGDTVTYVISYRNMGNTPIRSVSIVDSLLPRLEYVQGTAKGPKGTAFTAAENRVGSTELKWELDKPVPPGGSGYVSFQAVIR